MTMLTLTAGHLVAVLAPMAGGSIARFAVEARGRPFELLRPADPGSIAAGRGSNASSYPLVPYSNRIADGRLVLHGRRLTLAPNWPGQRHPMHGDGWAHPWDVVLSSAAEADLVYLHDGRTGWPFRFAARQSFRLSADALTIAMEVENREEERVPAGLGLHPFFAREPDTTLTCAAARVWLADAEVLPTTRVEVPPASDFHAPRRVNEVALDNCFDGWGGRASVTWPSRGLRLDLEATPLFGHVVLYIPPERPYFCVEPVSHANNAFALHALGVEDVGHRLLGPGDRIAGEVVFRVRRL